jgi:hypothetical protein
MPVLSHGGDPTLGSNTVLTIDGTDLQLTDPVTGNPVGPVLPTNQAFNVSMVFELLGTLTPALTADPNVSFTISYAFEPRVPPGGTVLNVGPTSITAATPTGGLPPFVYGAPDTTVNVPANTLTPGLYELSAAVTFPSNSSNPWAMAAFCDFEVIDMCTP